MQSNHNFHHLVVVPYLRRLTQSKEQVINDAIANNHRDRLFRGESPSPLNRSQYENHRTD